MRRSASYVLLALSVWLLAAPAAWAQEAGTEAETPPKPPTYLSATVVVTELDGDGAERSQRMSLRKYGNKVRTIAEDPGDGQFVGDTLYDYDAREYFRKLVDQDITFVYRLVTRERVKAQIFGYMDKPSDEDFFTVVVNEDLEFDGHPCTLSLVGFPAGGRIHALHWVWQARDLDDAVVRVVFPETYDRIIIVDYLDAHSEPFDLKTLELPEGTVVMSAF